MEKALIKEINGEYVEAVKCYENELANNESSISPNSYINLAFLYWSFAFDYFGFDIPNNIPDDYSIIGGNRYQIILDLGLKNYPNNLELIFWNKYFQHIIFGEEFSKSNCKQLIDKYGDSESIVPYFFLYLFEKEKYIEKRNELLDTCIKYPTAKNNYIKSIIAK
jgi:hypothetical protein